MLIRRITDTDVLVDMTRNNQAAIDYLDSLGVWSLSIVSGLELVAGAKDQSAPSCSAAYLRVWSGSGAAGAPRKSPSFSNSSVVQDLPPKELDTTQAELRSFDRPSGRPQSCLQ